MRLRYWLNDIFQQAEETPDASSGAGGNDKMADMQQIVANWSASRGHDDPPAKAEKADETAPAAEPEQQELPDATAPDAVAANSDDDATDADDQSESREESAGDPLLMNLLEAYDYSPEDVAGLDADGLKRLLAREQRLHGTVPPADTKADTEPAPAAQAASAGATQTQQSPAAQPTSVTFADVQKELEEKLTEEGFAPAQIQREVRLAKLRWEREEAIMADARSARQEAEQVRQLYHQREAEHARQVEVNTLLDMADHYAVLGHADLLGTPDSEWTAAQKDARLKFVQAYDVLRASNPDESVQRLGARAFHIAFHDDIQKREIKSQAKRILTQADKVLAAGSPTKAATQTGGKWTSNRNVARIAQRMKSNAGM